MKTIGFAGLVALVLSACATVEPFPKDAVLEGSITYGAYVVPLPEGRWTVIGEQKGPSGAHMKLGRLALARFRGDGAVDRVMTIDTVLSYGSRRGGGWMMERDCERENMHYVKKVVNTLSERECYYVNHFTPSAFSGGNSHARFADELRRRGVAIPANAIAAFFNQADKMNRLVVTVVFNPEAEGLPPSPDSDWTNTEWNSRNIDRYPERKAYVDKIVAWTKAWEPRYREAFGRPK